MFTQLFETEPPTYFLPSERNGIPSGTGLGSLYNPYLVTPPRIYGESFISCRGLFVKKERTPYSDFTIYVHGITDSIYWPSYGFVTWRFDGITGAYLDRREEMIGGLYSYQITQTRDGALWQSSILGDIYEIDPLDFSAIAGTEQDPTHFGLSELNIPLVDRPQDLIIVRASSVNGIAVYEFTSGALVRTIETSGQPAQIFPEDNHRCYVLCTNRMLNLVDYVAGEILSTLRSPQAIENTGQGYALAWDPYLRRILVWTQRDDDTDGACLSTLSGYYPIPLAVTLSAPVPIRAPRAGRTTPFLTRVVGDAGEAIPGVKVTPTTGTSAIVGAPPFADRDGEAIVSLLPDAEGTDTLILTATV